MLTRWLLPCALLLACSDDGPSTVAPDARTPDARVDAAVMPDAGPPIVPTTLAVNEVMSSNDGAYIDEDGDADDWFELINVSDAPLMLSEFEVADGKGDSWHALPARTLAPGELVVFWADDDSAPAGHFPFKLGKEGDTLHLRRAADQQLVERVQIPELRTNEAYARHPDGSGAFDVCTLPTPAQKNGASCSAGATQGLDEDAKYAPYSWPNPTPARPSPVAITELALRPAGFIELHNSSASAVSLDDYALLIATHAPGRLWPTVLEGEPVHFPFGSTLAAGARQTFPVSGEHVAALERDPRFEGVVTLFRVRDFELNLETAPVIVDRVDFDMWPAGAVLSRAEGDPVLRFCTNATPNAADACQPLASRDVGDRVRHLYTPGDLNALAAGGTALGSAAVKFVIELQGLGATHLLSARRWPLHFTFVREVIDGLPAIDRCSEQGNALFQAQFSLFIGTEYFNVPARRFLLGTLVHHTGAGLHTIEFTSGDLISAAQIETSFDTLVTHIDAPRTWALRPADVEQATRMRELDGKLPIVDRNAPYRGQRFQALTPAVGYGTLTFVSSAALSSTALGRDVIVVTDAVPNDMPLAGGLITEAFQTPLAHVNLLSQARRTPNMALADARAAPEVAPLLGKLVRFEVSSTGFTLVEADPSEAQAFWDARRPTGEPYAPRLDTSVRGIVALAGRGIEDLPVVGAKAAQLAELSRVRTEHAEGCKALPLLTPSDAFAIPMAHYREHFVASGAEAELASARAQDRFATDPRVRSELLAKVRARIESHPVDPALLAQVQSASAPFAGEPRRFRSSSNAEDLLGFNGAGLYESENDDEQDAEQAIKKVWASLWLERAYDERAFANLNDGTLAMGVLVHRAFRRELANGVAMSRNLLDPTRSDQVYLNAQRGGADVTNPAPNVSSEQLVYTWPPFTPELSYRSRSTFTPDGTVLTPDEVRALACSVGAIHDHFQAVLDPQKTRRWFTVELEFKVTSPARALAIKQARPFPVDGERLPADCR
ncbi:MAG: PEP/pyruvate-binding domain-containing protein [Polyangiales bacterium]